MSPRSSRRRRYGGALATAATAIVIVGGTAIGVRNEGTPTPPSDATWFVAAGGSDANSCASTTDPCLTLNGAYQKVTNPSQVIEVACGTYSTIQTVMRNTGLATGTHTVIRPPAGEPDTCVNFTNRIDLGTEGTTTSGPRWLRIQDVSFYQGVWQQNPATDFGIRTHLSAENIVVHGILGGKVEVQGSKFVTAQYNDLAGCKANINNQCGNRVSGQIRNSDNTNVNAEGTQYLYNLVHDYTIGGLGECGDPNDTCHTNGITIFSNMGARAILRGNKLWGNSTQSIALQIQNQANVENVTIENNWIGPGCAGRVGLEQPAGGCGALAMEIRDPIPGLIIRFNTFPWHQDADGKTGAGFNCANEGPYNCGTAASRAEIVGNISVVAGNSQCNMDAANVHYNVFRQFNAGSSNPPSPCNTTSTNYSGSNNVFVNDTNGANFVLNSVGSTMDLHLTGSAAPPQNYVPASQANGCGAGQNVIDIDEQVRPINTNCDAGSDER